MQINRSQRSNNYTKGRPYGIKSITIHHWGIPGQSHSNVVRYLCRKNGSTSAHYVVSGGGGISEIVDPGNRAWHTGHGLNTPNGGNATSIGIECRPEMSASDVAAVIELVQHLKNRYGNLTIYGHSHWKNTACPGKWVSLLNKLSSIKPGGTVSKTTVATDTPPTPTIEETIAMAVQNRITTLYAATDNGIVVEAHLTAGTWRYIRDPEELRVRQHVLTICGQSWAWWGTLRGREGDNVIGDLRALGREV